MINRDQTSIQSTLFFFIITYKCPFTNNTPKWIKVWIPKWRFVPTDIVPSVYKGPCFQVHSPVVHQRTQLQNWSASNSHFSFLPERPTAVSTQSLTELTQYILFVCFFDFFFFTVILANIETYQVHFQELELELTHQGKWVLEVDERNSHVEIPFERQAWSMNL